MRGLMQDHPLLISSLIEHAGRCHSEAEIVTRTCEGPVAHVAYGNLSAAVAEGVSGFTVSPLGRLNDIAAIDVAE